MYLTNLKLLKEYFPKTWATFTNIKRGLDSQLVRLDRSQELNNLIAGEKPGIFIHSNRDPIIEAESIISEQQMEMDSEVVFYGAGLGYHIEVFTEKYPQMPFVIYEPVPEVFFYLLSYFDFSKLPLNLIKNIYIETHPENARYFSIDFLRKSRNFITVFELPSYKKAFPQKHKKFFRDFENAIAERQNYMMTNLAFEKRWMINSMVNFKEVLNTPNILIAQKDQFKNKTAVIVAAGPSLEEEYENIRYIKEKGWAYIFSVGSAIIPLIANNIYPDIAFTHDPKKENQLVFKGLVEKGINTIPLVFGSTTGYETIENYPGPKLHVIISQDTVSPFYLKSKANTSIEIINDAPSIAAVTLQVLAKLGFNPIILVGQNLALKEKKQYADGIMHHQIMATEEQLKNAIKIKDVAGHDILTTPDFNRMRQQIEMYIQFYKDLRVFNTSKGGAHIQGTIFITLAELIKNMPDTRIVDKSLSIVPQFSYDKGHLLSKFDYMNTEHMNLEELLCKTKQVLGEISQLAQTNDFRGIDQKYAQFNHVFGNLKANQFFKSFIMPMNRVEAEFLKLKVTSIAAETDHYKKSQKVLSHFGKFLNACERDIRKINNVFEDMNENINNFLAGRETVLEPRSGRTEPTEKLCERIPLRSLSSLAQNIIENPKMSIYSTLDDLMLKQYSGNIFNRIDIIVRYLAIEQYYGKNDLGYHLFIKMQEKRHQDTHTLEKFKVLIDSIARDGFDNGNSIIVNENLELLDGSHRLACALYFGLGQLPVNIRINQRSNPYSLAWFEQNGFQENEIEAIKRAFRKVLIKLKLYFVIILWPPIQEFFEQISRELKKDYIVADIQDHCFDNENEYAAFVRGVYAIDDIRSWKIDKKIEHMKNHDKKIRIISLVIDDPIFRKKINGKNIAIEMEKIKYIYRNKYSEMIDNYFNDVIMHAGDNYEHTKHIKQLIKKDIKIMDFLEAIKYCKYVLVKTQTPYMPADFPYDYPLNKDLDLISLPSDFGHISSAADYFSDEYQGRYQIRKYSSANEKIIRFELNGYLCYQLDIRCSTDGIEGFELEGVIANRKANRGYYVPQINDELSWRLYEYANNPRKVHHLNYIEENSKYLSPRQRARLLDVKRAMGVTD